MYNAFWQHALFLRGQSFSVKTFDISHNGCQVIRSGAGNDFQGPQGLQISLMSGVSLTSASQILESFWNIWSQVSDFPARGPGMYTLS